MVSDVNRQKKPHHPNKGERGQILVLGFLISVFVRFCFVLMGTQEELEARGKGIQRRNL